MTRDRDTEDLLRDALASALPRGTHLVEKPMFGALGFMLNGNLLAGASHSGMMFRTGKDAHDEALDLPGVGPMEMSGRTMGGYVRADETAYSEPDTFDRLIGLAIAATTALPPK